MIGNAGAPERELRVDRPLRRGADTRGQLAGSDRFRRGSVIYPFQQLTRLCDRCRRGKPALDQGAPGVVMLDPEDRQLDLRLSWSREQRDQQLGAPGIDPHRLLNSEHPHSSSRARDDAFLSETLRAPARQRTERFGGEHRERRQHTSGVRIAAGFDPLDNRARDIGRQLSLLERDQQGRGQLLQLGWVVELWRAVKHRDELRDDLRVQDL